MPSSVPKSTMNSERSIGVRFRSGETRAPRWSCRWPASRSCTVPTVICTVRFYIVRLLYYLLYNQPWNLAPVGSDSGTQNPVRSDRRNSGVSRAMSHQAIDWNIWYYCSWITVHNFYLSTEIHDNFHVLDSNLRYEHNMWRWCERLLVVPSGRKIKSHALILAVYSKRDLYTKTYSILY